MNKRENPILYFLKLQDEFFESNDMKRLRRVAGGAVYIVIYLRMLLKSLPYGGKLYFEGLDSSFEEQIALMIDENVDDDVIDENIDDEEISLYLLNAKSPCFIRDDSGSYVYIILPVNFNNPGAN